MTKVSLFAFAPTATRVQANTEPMVNEWIRRRTLESIAWHCARPAAIPGRLLELDREWDVERALSTSFSVLTLVGILLGYFVALPWLIIPTLAQLFYVQHCVQGWCPALPLFRRLGLRTEQEIQFEHNELVSELRFRTGAFSLPPPADWTYS